MALAAVSHLALIDQMLRARWHNNFVFDLIGQVVEQVGLISLSGKVEFN